MSGFLTPRTRRVLKSLVAAYLSPDTAGNQALRQCLASFFPVYCYSSSVNQNRMRQVRCIGLCADPDSNAHDRSRYRSSNSSQRRRGVWMTTKRWYRLHRLLGMFVDWTDPQKAM
jgi:condensin complex subunit 3